MGILAAIEKAEQWMDDIDGVEGVAEGEQDGKPTITVFVSKEEAKAKLPTELEGYPVVVEENGPFEAY